MNNKTIDKEKLIKYWIDSSDDDYDTMIDMFKSKKVQLVFIHWTFND